MPEPKTGHDRAERGGEARRSSAAGTCGAGHPLLKDVRCERLPGHPGRHGAVADIDAAELTLGWNDDPEEAG